MGSYLEDQLAALKAIKNVSRTSSLGTSELFKIFVEMRRGVEMLCSETAEATGNDAFKPDNTDDDDKKEPRQIRFQLAGVEMCASEDDGCALSDNGRIVDDQA